MMSTHSANNTSLSGWLQQVSEHLDQRRVDKQGETRPKRNRARERARREARQLFREYDTEQTLTAVLQ
jgi:hypothetical protein